MPEQPPGPPEPQDIPAPRLKRAKAAGTGHEARERKPEKNTMGNSPLYILLSLSLGGLLTSNVLLFPVISKVIQLYIHTYPLFSALVFIDFMEAS